MKINLSINIPPTIVYFSFYYLVKKFENGECNNNEQKYEKGNCVRYENWSSVKHHQGYKDAQEALAAYVMTLLDDGTDIPAPSELTDISTEKESFVT